MQADLRAAFFDSDASEATQQLRAAMHDIDLNADSNVSLNEFVRFGLAAPARTSDSGAGASGSTVLYTDGVGPAAQSAGLDQRSLYGGSAALRAGDAAHASTGSMAAAARSQNAGNTGNSGNTGNDTSSGSGAVGNPTGGASVALSAQSGPMPSDGGIARPFDGASSTFMYSDSGVLPGMPVASQQTNGADSNSNAATAVSASGRTGAEQGVADASDVSLASQAGRQGWGRAELHSSFREQVDACLVESLTARLGMESGSEGGTQSSVLTKSKHFVDE